MKKTISFNVVLFALISSLNLSINAEENAAHDSANLRYSLRGIDRPSIMPTGIVSIETAANVKGLKTTVWDVNTKFGIINKLEGQFGYDGVTFNDPNAKNAAEFSRSLSVGVKYNYFSINHISASASSKLPIYVLDGEIVRDVNFGLPVVFYNSLMAGSIFGDIFKLTMRPNVEMTFDFSWWYGLQVYGNLWADISSSFGKIEMKNPNNQADWKNTPFWKELPLTLTLLYGINPYLDVTGNFGFENTLNAKETMKFGVGLNFRAGKLFG